MQVPAARRSEKERAVRRRQRAVAAAMIRAGLHVRRHLSEHGTFLLCSAPTYYARTDYARTDCARTYYVCTDCALTV